MLADWGVSIRRACAALTFDTSTYHYKSRRPGQAAIERRIREICQTRVRYGCRRVHVLLRREGWMINMKKTRRIYNELGLQLRNKHPKRRVKAKLREDRQEAVGPNDVWAMDFVHDQFATGKKIRVLTVVDTVHPLRACARSPVQLPSRGRGLGTLEQVCPKRPLVPNVCRCGRKDGGLAQILQRGPPAWGDRAQRPDLVAQSRWRYQPAIMTTGRKLQHPVVPRMVSEQLYILSTVD